MNELIFRGIFKLLSDYVVKYKDFLRKDCTESINKAKGNSSEANVCPKSSDVVRHLAPLLLWCAYDCIVSDVSLMPSLSFLASCCFNVVTEHVCSRMISQVVSMCPYAIIFPCAHDKRAEIMLHSIRR